MSARRRRWILGLALLIAAAGALWASEHPDTLERFLEGEGVEESTGAVPGPLPDSRAEAVESERWSRVLAGSAGVLATFGLLTLMTAIHRRRSIRDPDRGGSRAP